MKKLILIGIVVGFMISIESEGKVGKKIKEAFKELKEKGVKGVVKDIKKKVKTIKKNPKYTFYLSDNFRKIEGVYNFKIQGFKKAKIEFPLYVAGGKISFKKDGADSQIKDADIINDGTAVRVKGQPLCKKKKVAIGATAAAGAYVAPATVIGVGAAGATLGLKQATIEIKGTEGDLQGISGSEKFSKVCRHQNWIVDGDAFGKNITITTKPATTPEEKAEEAKADAEEAKEGEMVDVEEGA